jgi:CubicO group peptidase (beta-lactamase class C family)
MSKGLDTAGNVGLFGQMEPSAPFRSKFQYQNLGFVVAGEIAAAELGVSWASGIRDYLFAPLGMDGARAISSDVLPTDLVALPHAGDGETSIAPRNIDAAGACGSVYASIADMSKWVQFNLQNSRAKPSAFADLYQPQIEISPPAPEFPEIGAMHYGLGWAVSSYRGHRLIWHNGGIDGYASQVLFFPDLNLGFVVLTNGGALDPSIVGYTVADVALGVEGTDWLTRFESPPSPSFPADKEFPTSYAAAIGEYTHPVYGRLNVTVKEIEGEYYVAAELNHGIELGFVPWIESPTEWLHDHGRWYASFRFASEGALVETVAINLEPAVAPIQFVRVR